MKDVKQDNIIRTLQLKVTDLLAEKSTLEEENVRLRERVKEIETELKETRNVINVELMDNEIKKLILKNYARNKSSLSIHKNIGKYYGISIDEIEEITKNIDSLDSTLLDFYKNEVEYFKNNDVVRFLSEQEQLKDSIDVILSSLDSQIISFGNGFMSDDDFKRYMELLARKKDFISIRLKLIDTYKDGTSLTNQHKENSNNISVEIKKQINNVLNINEFKEKGIKVSKVSIAEEVEKWK